jgi:hypothetical protein
LLLAAAATALLGSRAAMGADTVRLGANLSGSQEVPPVATEGTGALEGTFDPGTRRLTYTVTHSGLSGPATMGHFHGPAGPGHNAGVVVPFANAASPIKGEATLTDTQAADLMAGRWYVNVHTAAHPSGEIRGQVKPA